MEFNEVNAKFRLENVEEIQELQKLYGLSTEDLVIGLNILSLSCGVLGLRTNNPKLSKMFQFLSALVELK